jgi:pSer/pThr/pTyr-binding forkhead associated (FHA) protein
LKNHSIKYRGHGLLLRSDQGREFALGPETLIGREQECQIVLDEDHVSRYHAKITLDHNRLTIEDLHSRNGTYVNGARLEGIRSLGIGDEIRFDQSVFRVVTADSGAADSTVFRSPYQHSFSSTDAAPASPSRPQKPKAKARPGPVEPSPSEMKVEPVNVESSVVDADLDVTTMNKGLDLTSHEYAKRAHRGPIVSPEQTVPGAFLLVLSAPLRGKQVALDTFEGDEFVVGRSESCDLYFSDSTVSQKHARFYRVGERWCVSNLGSTNGVSINGSKADHAWLNTGDTIKLGRIEMQFGRTGRQMPLQIDLEDVASASSVAAPSLLHSPWLPWLIAMLTLSLLVLVLLIAFFRS